MKQYELTRIDCEIKLKNVLLVTPLDYNSEPWCKISRNKEGIKQRKTERIQ